MKNLKPKHHYLAVFFVVFLAAMIPAAVSAAGNGTVTMDTPHTTDGYYYWGDNITFSGTNTASDTTYVFLTGFGFPPEGGQIHIPDGIKLADSDASTFLAIPVGPDGRWSWTWDSQNQIPYENTYTVYAVSTPRDAFHLDNAIYATAAIPLRYPTLSVDVSPQDAEQGEAVTISGLARGGPVTQVAIWVIGPSYSDRFIVHPDPDGFYSMTIDSATTHLDEGNYHVVAQHPCMNPFDVILKNEYVYNTRGNSNVFRFLGYGRLTGEEAYDALMGQLGYSDLIETVTFHVRANPSAPVGTPTPGRGTITMIPSPSTGGSYYTGDPITFSGTNTASDTTYLFITGFLYDSNGAQIDNNPWENPVVNGDASTFVAVPVGPDHTWSWSWNTQNVAIWEKTYIVFAASAPRDVSHLDDAVYTTNSVPIKYPTVSAEVSPQDAEPGEKITISGTAKGGPVTEVAIWIIGPRYSDRFVVHPDSAGFYSMNLDSSVTPLDEGDYHVIVQHPGMDREYVITLNGEYVYNTRIHSPLFRFRGYNRLTGERAYEALMDQFVTEFSDSIAAPVRFHVQEDPSAPPTPGSTGDEGLTIRPSPSNGGYYYVGDQITFSGINPASNTTYLFITGWDYPANGGQIQDKEFQKKPVVDGDASTFQAVPVGPDGKWSWTWDTDGAFLRNKTYTVYAASAPRDVPHLGDAAYATNNIPMRLPALSADISPGTTAITPGSPVTYSVMIDQLPQGLSGYIVTIAVENPDTAEIIEVATPETGYPAFVTNVSTMPSDRVRIKKLHPIVPGTGNFELFNVTVQGITPGTTNITLIPERFDGYHGDPLSLIIAPAVLTVDGAPVTAAPVATEPVPGITSTISPDVTEANPTVTTTISPEVTDANPTVTTTVSPEVTEANPTVTTTISPEVTDANPTVTTTISLEVTDANPTVTPEVTGTSAGSGDKALEPQNQKIHEQNRILEEQKQLIDEQDRKIKEQQNLLNQLMEMIRAITGQG